MDSFDVCSRSRPNVDLLAGALKPLLLLVATHLLSGEVDTTLAPSSSSSTGFPPLFTLWRRLTWLVRYFNPVNLSWRYYSILAWRAGRAATPRPHHMAIVNHEAHPWEPPLPFVLTDSLMGQDNYCRVRRIEMGTDCFVSSQGVLTMSAAYQLALAALVMSGLAGGRIQLLELPNLSLPLFVLSLGLRVSAFPWIASKVYVDPYPYPAAPTVSTTAGLRLSEFGTMRRLKIYFLSGAWTLLLLGFVSFSFWPWPATTSAENDDQDSSSTIDWTSGRLLTAVQILYRYASVSHLGFHVALMRRGAMGWANRIAFFDHWIYWVQTMVWVLLLAVTLLLAFLDLLHHDFNRPCSSP